MSIGKLRIRVDGRRYTAPLDLSEVAAMLDEDPRRLRRYLLAVERDKGVQVLTRLGSAKRPHYKVTLSALRRHCPELVSEPEVDAEKERMADIEAAFRTMVEHIGERHDGLRQEVLELRGMVDDLAVTIGQEIEAIRARLHRIEDPRSTATDNRTRGFATRTRSR